ncbi:MULTISPECIES: Crp/Fnr family transcriptional regulator [Roseivirga]|uniref:Crp/Fnr family transcriptional regulator n=1 Tax=Roseivirga spongicola TaxID=333140 RepID=A0A150WZH7_9BACT|nr:MULTISPECIES: Crp/Fnr family transcriptional regulator [Roseivirga]KYG71873.1 Crp/Fnr family transcriptional regulator [Roseivirga spongicola]MBO6662151.1 Crp/Fnr family transcriptional regulator [Roseivirga sp.]MBO6762431.1 Crp/Fnr family transcriptional regulator [Roseivirga sp.]MBO6910121.1 Crp/Fnr family transcriptional regulator [Roseivirga sp.]WPZ08997.1 Crp/Fnr family transcriptional regulator [Roseivirga spongicola]
MKIVTDALEQVGLEGQLIEEIVNTGRFLKVREGQPLIEPGMEAKEMPLVINGTLRVMREDKEGREIFLYYLEGGDACAMSISCCLGTQISEFKVVAEEDATLWMVSMHYIDTWMVKYRSFRKFIFDSYHDRFDEMLNTVDGIAFMNMDQRLMKYLLDKKQSTGSFVINKTHEQIAQELNTSRVVVSRLLKKLEREDKIELHRNRIEVL